MLICKCRSRRQDIETDQVSQATMIECLSCGRVVGGLSEADAVEMWSAAMGAGAKPHNRARDGKDRSKR
jgi:hypothetical protein